jgi:serine/threonine protein kinase
MEAFDALHPTDQMLQHYGLGKLDDVVFQKVTKHLEDCPPCQNRVAEMSSDSFLGRLQQAQGAPLASGGDSPQKVGPIKKSAPDPVPSGAHASSTLPAELLDHPDYEIVRELGRGGMGVVYLVHNRLMGRHEAIKVISRQLMERPIVLDRFLREIRSVAKLRHPNVVAAYSATRIGESIVYAMEYVEGLDLARLVKTKGPLPVTHACYFTYQAALGLQHAHEQGIVHRDIKPGNLILSRTGERATVKILDFGLNKATTDDPADHSLTREGQMLGTPDYIAPEQTLDAQSVDIRADIYSLGCTLYYLLSGGPPFRGGSLYEVLQAHHSSEATALNLMRPEVPLELAAVVSKMMAKQPGQRFQKPAEAAQALTPFFKKTSVASAGQRPEYSQAGHTVPQQKTSSTGAVPTQPDNNIATAGASRSKLPMAASARSESSWESFFEFGETERLIDAVPAAGHPAVAARRLWPLAAVGVVACGLFALWSAGAFTPKSSDADAAKKVVLKPAIRAKEQPVAVPSDVDESSNRFDSTTPSTKPNGVPVADISKAADNPAPNASKDGTGAALGFIRPETASKPVKAPAEIKAKNIEKVGYVDVRHITNRPGVMSLIEAGAILPILEFWPLFTPEDVTAWQVADPASIRMNASGVVLYAGEGGNFLLTRRMDFKKCKILVSLAAFEGTEAYLALRAHNGPDGWLAVTSRIDEQGKKIRAGTQSVNFQVPVQGKVRDDFTPGKFFSVVFKVDGQGNVRVLISGKETASQKQVNDGANGDVGAAGLFVRSGRIVIRSLSVTDSD